MFYDPITKIPIIGPYYNYIVPLLLLLVIGIQVTVKVRERVQRRKGLSEEQNKAIREGERIAVQEIKKQERQQKIEDLKEEPGKRESLEESNVEMQMQQSLLNPPPKDETPQEMFGILTESGVKKHFQLEKSTLVAYKDSLSATPLFSLSFSEMHEVSEQGSLIMIELTSGKTSTLTASSSEEA